MSIESIIALIMAVLNIGLTILLSMRKESKEEARIREENWKTRERELKSTIENCDKERNILRDKVIALESKQSVWDSLLPHFKLVQPITGGHRQYDERGPSS